MTPQFPYDHFFEYYGEDVTLPVPEGSPPGTEPAVIRGIHDFEYEDDALSGQVRRRGKDVWTVRSTDIGGLERNDDIVVSSRAATFRVMSIDPLEDGLILIQADAN